MMSNHSVETRNSNLCWVQVRASVYRVLTGRVIPQNLRKGDQCHGITADLISTFVRERSLNIKESSGSLINRNKRQERNHEKEYGINRPSCADSDSCGDSNSLLYRSDYRNCRDHLGCARHHLPLNQFRQFLPTLCPI